MADIEIRFRMNLETGKKDIFIDFESDEDAMRHEHERDHKRIIQQLIEEGVLNEDEVGDVTVERVEPGEQTQQTEGPQTSGPEAQAQGSGG